MARIILQMGSLGDDDYDTITLEVAESISNVINTSFSGETIIPTLDAERRFLIDSGSTQTYTFEFSRKNPTSSSEMTNAEYIQKLVGFINRWQVNTNGCVVSIIPDSGDSYEIASESFNAYISTLTYSYSKGVPDLITGSIRLTAGSLYGTQTTSTVVPSDEMSVMISNSEGTAWYFLMNRSFNCIDEYTLYGGPNQPFEYIELKIPRRRLESFAGPLIDNDDLIAGKNQLIVNAIGVGNFIITRCKLSDDVYTLSAYSYAEVFAGTLTTKIYSEVYTPMQIILDILNEGMQIGSISVNYSASRVISRFNESNNAWSGSVAFPEGSNAWYVMQVCALRMNCRIWFSENYVYLFDQTNSLIPPVGWDTYQTRPLSLFGLGTTDPSGGDDDPIYIYQNVLDTAELGDEGTSQLCTEVVVYYTDSSGSVQSVMANCNETALEYYGARNAKTLRIYEILNEDDALIIGQNYCEYLCEAQTSIGFSVRELDEDGWHRAFETTSGIRYIYDEMDELTVSSYSKVDRTTLAPQTLCQSTFTRQYPEGYTTYWYGILQNNDLTQTVSSILSSINNP